MFQKHFAVESANKVSGKDRKKLRATLQRLYPRFGDDQLESIFPLKEGECTVARIKAPHRAHLYLLNGLPLIMELSKSEGVVPCLPVLWQIPHLLPAILVKHFTVSKFILGGADLMLPGVETPFQDGFLRGTLVSLCVPGNPCPFAIGRATMSSIEAMEDARGKGRLVEIILSYGDLVTSHFTRMPPPNSGFTPALISPIEEPETPTPEEQEGSASVEEEEEEVPLEELSLEERQQEMDDLLKQCFFQALRKSVKDKDLPLPAGELWIKHMLPNKQPGINVDVKLSSFKKLSKFLQQFASGENPLLTLKVEKYSKETVITFINREHSSYEEFRPYAVTQAILPETVSSNALHIEETYRMGRELNSVLLALGLEPGCILPKKDAAEVAFRYVQYANLDQGVPDREHVVLDRVLGEALFRGLLKKNEKTPEYWPKSQLADTAMKRMHRQYRISRGPLEILKKGLLPHVQIRQTKRSGNKFETRIAGLETFLIDVSSLASIVQKRFACSTSLQDAFHKGVKENELVMQGRKSKEMAALLNKEFGIPERLIQL